VLSRDVMDMARRRGLPEDELLNIYQKIRVEMGKYRKYDIDEAIECFIRKHILCMEYNPVTCRRNRLVREIYRNYIGLVSKYRVRDCNYLRFSGMVRYYYKLAYQTLSELGYLEKNGDDWLSEDLVRWIYAKAKHIDPVGVSAFLIYERVDGLPVRRVANILVSRKVFKGYDSESIVSLIYRLKLLFNSEEVSI